MHRFTLLVGGAVVTVALWAPVVGAQEQEQRRDYSQNEGPRYRDIGQDRREVARDVGNVRQDERELGRDNREIWQDRREIARDKQEIRQDQREIGRDEREIAQDRARLR